MADKTPASASRTTGAVLIIAALLIAVFAIVYSFVRGPSSSVPEGFVYAEDGQFMLDGEPFYYAGANAYTLMYEAEPSVDMYMRSFQESNLKVARAWAFFDTGTLDGDLAIEGNTRNVFFHYWDPEAGAPAYNDGPNGLERLDYMIYSASQHDVKLVLPFVNNWNQFGGVDQYVRWADGEYHDDFFTDPQIRQWYKDWVEMLLNRENTYSGIVYKDDPTIFAWEVGNELRCSDSGFYPVSDACGSEMLNEWTAEMSAFVKSIDPHHMVGFGGEGFLCEGPDPTSSLFDCTESADPVFVANLESIDMNGIHVYPNHWQPQEPTSDWEDWGVWWIEEHGRIAAEANKPYFIGEYGWIDAVERPAVFDRWLEAFYGAGGDGSHFWLMQPGASITPPADGVGFTQKCPGAACDLVGNWTLYLSPDGGDWNQFAPIGVTDYGSTTIDGTVTVDVLANDILYGDATWDEASIDLDPETPGVQSELVTSRGTFTAADGVITFTSNPGEEGTARLDYTVTDSRGNSTEPTRLSIGRSDDT